MKRLDRSALGLLLCLLSSAGRPGLAAEVAAGEVPLELWDRPRSGRAVIALPAVRDAMGQLLAKPEAKLAIRHPPGVEASVQAEELKAWLVAHAIQPERIDLRADLPARQPLQLEIVPRP